MTPCEEKGYKVGDVFEVIEDFPFKVGDRIQLIKDDGSSAPKFKGIGCVARDGDVWHYNYLHRVKPIGIKRPEQVILAPGDYVSTAGMDEATYHAVARAFIEAGAKQDYSNPKRTEASDKMMWDKDGDIDAGPSLHNVDNPRCLTADQVINSTNAGGNPEPIAALRVAKTALENARDAYSKALDAVRDELGEGFVLIEDDGVKVTPEPDMTDPTNWKAGDVLRCVDDHNCRWVTKGKRYIMEGLDMDGWPMVTDDDGDIVGIKPFRFRFHHRPNT